MYSIDAGWPMLTVRYFKAQQANEEEGGHIGELIVLEIEVLGQSHDSSVLEPIRSHKLRR